MVTKATLLIAAAFVVCPPRPANRVAGSATHACASVHPAWIPAGVGAVALVALTIGRAGVVIAAAMAAAVVIHTLQTRRAARQHAAQAEASAAYIGHLAEAVAAGSAMADAVSRAAERLPEKAPAGMRRDVARFTAYARQGTVPPELFTAELRRVASLWTLAQTRGVPIAGLLAAARDEIDAQLQHRAATEAALSGPKTTATVLSLLPLAGIGMGAAMGANPVALLTGPGIGAVLLVVGTALVSGGVLASSAIIRRAAA